MRYQYQAAYDLQQEGELDASLSYLEQVARFAPDYELAGFLRGYALQTLGRWQEAEAQYRAFLEHRPDYVQAWFNLGHGLMEQGRHQEAVGYFHEVLRRKPDYASAHGWLSKSYAAVGDAEAAARHAALYEAARR